MSAIGNDYLSILTDGTVQLRSGKVDIGQGITTALAQIAADELDVSVTRIHIVRTDTSVSPEEWYTAGSLSIEVGGAAVKDAATTLKSEMLRLATHELDARKEDLTVSDGMITAPSGKTVTYWELAGDGAGADVVSIPESVGGVSPEGRRWDLPPKFRGEASFVHDLELPGLLHGRVVKPPSRNATLTSLDTSQTEDLDGIEKVVVSGSFIGVVATREEQALRAVRRIELDAIWDEPQKGPSPTDPRYLLNGEATTEVAADNVELSIQLDGRSLQAEYSRPYLAHASIGPSCAVAVEEDHKLTIWCASQGVFELHRELCKVLEIAEDDVRVIHLEGAGCYGHNGADDVALDAAILAGAVPGRPVRVQWSRADEFAWEPYGSPMVMQLNATLDDDGMIAGWNNDVWSHAHLARPGSVNGVGLRPAHYLENPHPWPGLKEPALPAGGLLRNAVPLYDLPNRRSTGHFVADSPVHTSALRGLGTHGNIFAIESFMDELAGLAGEDPVAFRLKHLSDERARAVINDVVDLAGVPIGGLSAEGHGYGLAFGQYKNRSCYVAVVAEVKAENEVRLVRVWVSVDAGRLINPDGVLNQIEGGVIQSASWALKEAVTFDGDRSTTRGWLDYPIMTFSEVPEIEVRLAADSDRPSLGVGEGAVGPTTAAIGNALAAALGIRIRDLPFTADRVTDAILAS